MKVSDKKIMKCVLLCLLAFCAIQAAFSYDPEYERLKRQLFELHMQAMQQVNDITNPILAQVQKDVDAAKANGKNAQPCYERARILMRSYVQPSWTALSKCRSDALTAQSVPYAISCNSGVVSTFRNNAQTVRPVATSCIAEL